MALQSFRLRVMFALLALLLPLAAGFTLFLYNHMGNHFEEQQRHLRQEVISDTRHALRLVDAGYKLLEGALEEDMELAFERFLAAYEASGGRPTTIDLERLRDALKIPADLYVLDTEGRVIHTTYAPDKGLDLGAFPEFKAQLASILRHDGMTSDRISYETVSGQPRKYVYHPTPDRRFILEIGLKPANFETLARPLRYDRLANQIAARFKGVTALRIFERHGYELSAPGRAQAAPQTRARVEEVFRHRRTVDGPDGPLEARQWFYVDLNDPRYPSPMSKVVEVVYDQSATLGEWRRFRQGVLAAFLLITLSCVLVAHLVSRWISHPVDRIALEVDRVAKEPDTHACYRPAASAPRELARLESSLEAMVARMADRARQQGAAEEALRQQQATLETTVVERTERLRASQARWLATFTCAPTPLFLIDLTEAVERFRATVGTSDGAAGPGGMASRSQAQVTETARALLRAIRVQQANNATLRLFEAPSTAAFDRRLDEILGDTGHRWLLQAFAGLLQGDREGSGEVQMHTLAGARLQVLLQWRLLEDEGDGMGCVCGILDLTALRDAEQALRRADRIAAVGALAGGIAHEFNNLNTPILGFAQLMIETKDLDEESRLYLERVITAATRARDITQRLLAFAGGGGPKRRPTPVASVVEDVVAMVRRGFEEDGIQWDLRLAELPPAPIDASAIGQVLLNLLINARHAMTGRPTRHLRIETGLEGERQYIRVADTGEGIPPERIPRLFDPFYSTKGEHAEADSPQHRLRGTGLGLSISDTIVREHGGEIAVASTLGEGTIFTIWLPTRGAVETEGPDATRPPAAPARELRVLLVDDEADVRDYLKLVLTKSGHHVTAAATAQDALTALQENPYDLLIVDLRMPEMDGEAMLRALRADPPSAGCPRIILLTGAPQSVQAGWQGELGIDVTLGKPVEPVELTAAVAMAFQGAAVPDGTAGEDPISGIFAPEDAAPGEFS